MPAMIVLLVLGCRPDPDLGPPSPATFSDPIPAVGAEVVASSGGREATVLVRSFNGVGGSVGGPEATLEVDGVAQSVTIGPQGYGSVVLDEPGSFDLRVGPSEVTAHVYGSDWPGLGLRQSTAPPMQTTNDAIQAGVGILTAGETEVWWSSDTLPPHRVLVTDGRLGGMVSGHYDGDGVLDAAVWAGGTVHFLRGRADGGMAYAAQLRSPSHGVSGVDFGDADSDGIPDLLVVWAGPPSAGRLDVWMGNGVEYEARPNRVLADLPFDVAAGDNTSEGRNQLTVTVEGGQWNRFFEYENGFAPIGPALELSLESFTRVFSPGDLNGDGTDDLLFVPPYLADTERRVVMFDLDEEVSTFTGINRVDAHLVIDDLDGDGLFDLLFSEGSGTLLGVHINDERDGLETDTLFTGLPEGGPVARLPGTDRILVAGENAWHWVEGRSTSDPTDPDEEWFAIVDRPLASPGVTARDGRFELAELDDDPGAAEVVAIRGGEGSTRLRVFSVSADGVVTRGDVELDPGEVPLRDLAMCDDDVFVLLEDALYRVDVSDPDDLQLTGSTALVGDRVACGPGPAGPVSVLADGSALLLDANLVQVGSGGAAGSVDLWLDELGTSTCDRADCEIVRGPVGADGAVVDVIGWPDGAEIDGTSVFGAGHPSVADIDGNGFVDVLFHAAGQIVVYRNTGEQLGEPEVYATRRPFVGTLAVADYDGDGFFDAWGIDPESNRVRITPSPSAEPVIPVDTADTGDTGAPESTGDTGAPDPSTGATAHTGTP